MSGKPTFTTVQHIRFGDVFRFGSILRAIGSSLNPTRIGIAMFTLALLVGGGRLWDAAVTSDASVKGPFAVAIEGYGEAADDIIHATLSVDVRDFVKAVGEMLWQTPANIWNSGHRWFVAFFGLWAAAVLAFGGGLLCRLEAVTVAQGRPAPLDPAFAMTVTRWPAFFMALLIPCVLIAMLAIALLLFGLLFLNIPILNVIGSIFYGMALLLGLAMALLLTGYAVAGLLLLPAVATENCEGPDALHRALAYVVAKPLSWLLYLFMIMLGLALGLMIVISIAELTTYLTQELVDLWTFNDTMPVVEAAMRGKDAPDASWHVHWTGTLIGVWTGLIQWAVVGWAIAYIMAASTRAYLLMRRACDDQDERDIWWPGMIPGTLAPAPPEDAPESGD